jgi:hypothetical protein
MLNDFTLSGGKAVLWRGKGPEKKSDAGKATFVQRTLEKYDEYSRERACERSRAARERKTEKRILAKGGF